MRTLRKISVYGVAAALASTLGIWATSPAVAQPLPSYASQSPDQTIHGTILSISGKYDIQVRDQRGYVDNVRLHQGTIINPTGLELAPGQSVAIVGQPDGATFAANEIDTPYTYVAPVAIYPYGFGYPYGYGYYGAPYRFGFRFGFRG